MHPRGNHRCGCGHRIGMDYGRSTAAAACLMLCRQHRPSHHIATHFILFVSLAQCESGGLPLSGVLWMLLACKLSRLYSDHTIFRSLDTILDTERGSRTTIDVAHLVRAEWLRQAAQRLIPIVSSSMVLSFVGVRLEHVGPIHFAPDTPVSAALCSAGYRHELFSASI